MNQSRNHHFIPKFLLKNFVNGSEDLWIFDKTKPYPKVRRGAPSSCFYKRDLNTLDREDGSLDTDLEDVHYDKIDTQSALVIQKILSCSEQRILPGLTADDRKELDEFIWHQYIRVPDRQEKTGTSGKIKAELPEKVAELELIHGNLSEEFKKKNIYSDRAVEKLLHESAVDQRWQDVPEKIDENYARRGLHIGVVSCGTSFIIGDDALTKVGREDGYSEYWYPISSKVVISLTMELGRSEALISFSREQARRLNESTYRQSNVVAGKDKALVCSLARRDFKKKVQ